MIGFLWSLAYAILILCLTIRLVAWTVQWYLRKRFGIVLKIGKFGFFSFGKIQFGIKDGLNVEIDKLWLSSCFYSQNVRKPVVVCIGDVRVQATFQYERSAISKPMGTRVEQGELIVPKFVMYLQHCGLRIKNVTLMLLKTISSDTLIHVTGQGVSLDATLHTDSFQIVMDVVGVSCRVLKSTSQDEIAEPCMAEMSISLFVDVRAHLTNLKQLKAARVLLKKPNLMLTEAFLLALQGMTQSIRRRPTMYTEANERINSPIEADVQELNHRIPHEIGIDISELDVKIVRETKQRTLWVGLKTFHVEFLQQRAASEYPDMFCNILIEDFHTRSPQAKFAELIKLNCKCLLSRDCMEVTTAIHGGFFHYHHEEIQYWATVMAQISHTDVSNLGHQETLGIEDISNFLQRPKQPSLLRSVLIDLMKTRKVSVVMEIFELTSDVSSASCSGFHLGLNKCRISCSLKPGVRSSTMLSWIDSHDLLGELELETFYWQQTDSHVSANRLSGKRHYWNHIICLGMVMLKLKKLGNEMKFEGLEDNLQMEWSTSTMNLLSHLIGLVLKSRPTDIGITSHLPVRGREKDLIDEALMKDMILSVKFDVTNVNLFTTSGNQVALMLRVDNAMLQIKNTLLTVIVSGIGVSYITSTDKFLSLNRCAEIFMPVIYIWEICVTYKHTEKAANIQLMKQVCCDWKTCHHMCFVQAVMDTKELVSKFKVNELTPKKASNSPVIKWLSNISINLTVNTQISATINLSKQHRMTFLVDEFSMTLTLPQVMIQMGRLVVQCDDNDILTGEGISVSTLPEYELESERKGFSGLILPTNRSWNVSFNLLIAIFPHNLNFAACFEEFVNLQKWMKLVHNVKKKPFTVDSPLPPDLRMLVKVFLVRLSDSPFEVKLSDNYELLKDECLESEKRRNMMDQKMQNLHRTYGVIPAGRIQELYASLDKKSSDIYIQRSKQLYRMTPARTMLFSWRMDEVEIIALADRSLHGKENVVNIMRKINTESPYPEEGLEFTTLWCRMVNFSVKSWVVGLRDYPQPMLDVKDMHLWGSLIGAEQAAAKQAKRTCAVEVDGPWGNMTVERSMPALKFYHDFSSDVDTFTMAYGACWEPTIAQYNLSMDLINRSSIDPSRPLPFWDKLRLLLHGRLTMSVQQMKSLYHASLDPFNTTELMDWSWTNMILDWTNARFVLKGDMDIYVRTASKYDDCRLLHLPNLKFCVLLEWLCHGDPNDHHSVMPCAPDKIPEYSLEEHDSFRAFRSKNLNLEISLSTRIVKEAPRNTPSYHFYASTLRFMDKIKMCLAIVTRPINRGSLFNKIKPRKLQLSRHYKNIRMSVNLHKFSICYWMSFSKQHGSELLADSFVLNMCNDLTLTPIEDGLIHRPRANWSVRYLNCELTSAKTWLCCARSESDKLNVSLRSPVEKSFFLSVSHASYQRSDSDVTDIGEDGKSTPTHNVQVYDMKGAWTKNNRTVLVKLYDSYMAAKSLKANLSSEAFRGFKRDNTQSSNKLKSAVSATSLTEPTPSPLSKLQTGHAYSMLMKLVSETDSKSVAFTEEPSSTSMDQLHGVSACQTDDVHHKNWLIELHNSQVVLKGCETAGYVIVSAAKAKILSCIHNPVWHNSQLRSKTTWVASVECMQYYATVDPRHNIEDDKIAWLSPENVEDRSESDLSDGPEMVGSGHSVGGVVSSKVGPTVQCEDTDNIQLQRIISRCKCEIFYVNYGDVGPNENFKIPLPPSEDSDMMTRKEGVDCLTLLHHDLNLCTNSLQYAMLLDIVNNLLLQVDVSKKEVTEKLQSMRFQLQLSRVEDVKTPIQQLQESVRKHVQKLRRLEKELYLVQKALEEDVDSESLLVKSEDLEERLYECKEIINVLNQELTIRISCFNESQLQVNSQMSTTKAQQAHVVRRNEVCFKFAQWRLTEADGQLGIADLVLRFFVYTKENRDNDTWTHQLELGWAKVTNLLPNSIYKDVLVSRDSGEKEGDNRQMMLRLLCSERPPVGGIAVKEHFEVNVVPLQVQLTYQFYKTVMTFLFPDKNIESEDQQDETDGSKKKRLSQKEKKESLKKVGSDDIDKMKERAANNNTFLYIKIPQVSLRLSYKGEKEKNIEDVHDFNFVSPTMEYHNCIWTWFDLLMAMKSDSKKMILAQAIKQKLHMKPWTGDDQPLTDVQQEEDKAKMLLGAKLLAGQEKPAKKTLFGKSSKS